MYLAVGGSDYYHDAAYRGGVPSSGWPVWLLFSGSTSRKADADPELKARLSKMVQDPAEWLARQPPDRASIFEGFPDQLQAYRDFYSHPIFDEYWKQRGYSPRTYIEQMKDVPMLFVSGWYDSFADATLDSFVRLSRL